MAHQWRGVIAEYADRLPAHVQTHVVTLGEGGTPLVAAPALSQRTGAEVYVKVEGMNPTGSFKDRGMTMAVSKAVEHGAKAVICASTGNTSASAAAYATHAGITAAVLVPEGKIAMGKLSQAVAHNAQLLQVHGNFDDCLEIARELADHYPVHLVNSVNNDRIEGQKTAAFEVVEVLGDAPDFHFIPVGNAGNYTAYAAADALVLPVLAQMTACDPAATAWVIATVIPRSLNDPVGLSPSTLSQTSQPVRPDSVGAGSSGVPPSSSVTTRAPAATGSRSRYASITPGQPANRVASIVTRKA